MSIDKMNQEAQKQSFTNHERDAYIAMDRMPAIERATRSSRQTATVIPFRTARFAKKMRLGQYTMATAQSHFDADNRDAVVPQEYQVEQQVNAIQHQPVITVGERIGDVKTIPFEIEIRKDSNLYEDYRKIWIRGKNGTETWYDKVVLVDGVIDENQTVKGARVETVEPTKEIRVLGTKPIVRHEIQTEVQDVPFETTYIYESSVPAGQTQIRLDGRNGVHTHTVRLTYTKEQLTQREIIKTVQTRPVRHRLVAFGDITVPHLASAKQFIAENPSVKRFIISDGTHQAYLQQDESGYSQSLDLPGWSLHFTYAVPVVAFYDGSPDISKAINHAIEAAIASDVPRVEMPIDQVFECDHEIIIKNGLSILNGNGSTLKATAREIIQDGMSALLKFEPNAQHVAVRGFKLDMLQTERLRGIMAQGTINTEISENSIYNTAYNAILVTTSAMSKTMSVRILNNEITAANSDEYTFNAIDVYGVASATLDNTNQNRLSQPSTMAIEQSPSAHPTSSEMIAQHHTMHSQVEMRYSAQSSVLQQALTTSDILIERNRIDGGRNGIHFSYTSNNRVIGNRIMNTMQNISLQNQSSHHVIKGNLLADATVTSIMIGQSSNYNTISANYISNACLEGKSPIIVEPDAVGNTITDNHIISDSDIRDDLLLEAMNIEDDHVQTEHVNNAMEAPEEIVEVEESETQATTQFYSEKTVDTEQAEEVIDFNPADGDKILLDATIFNRLKGEWFAKSPEEITDETVIFQQGNELYFDAGSDGSYFMATKFAVLKEGIQLQQSDFMLSTDTGQ